MTIRAELQDLLGTSNIIVANPGFSLSVLRREVVEECVGTPRWDGGADGTMGEPGIGPKAQQVAESEVGE